MTDDGISTLFSFDGDMTPPAKIRVIGVGGGGGNAINNMVKKGIEGIEFIAINTDAQALENNRAPFKLQVGKRKTKGLGAGARSGIGAEAATESQEEIESLLSGCDMAFITAGMGGGTGTGAAPVVSAIARKLGILTVAIVTRPFSFEGRKRIRTAEEGVALLRENVDTLILISNDRLLDISDAKTTVEEAFETADSVLYDATRGISDLITMHGHVNLDFADIKTTMQNGGTAIMSSATASGEERAERAAREALASPLLDGLSIKGARNVLVNITAGGSPGIQESMRATQIIQSAAGDEAELIWGVVDDESMGEDLRVTVIATGFEEALIADPKQRPSVSLDTTPLHEYKGMENVRHYDSPAYERRPEPMLSQGEAGSQYAAPSASAAAAAVASVSGAAPTTTLSRPKATEETAPRPSRVRVLKPADLDTRGERIRKGDPDTPAFLRKMMD